MISKKKKVFSKIKTDFTLFQPKNRSFQKKKVFTGIEADFSAKIGNSTGFSARITASTSQLRHPISFGGGCFHFFTKNRPQKRAILHTLQANGGDSSPPPPLPLATLLALTVDYSTGLTLDAKVILFRFSKLYQNRKSVLKQSITLVAIAFRAANSNLSSKK